MSWRTRRQLIAFLVAAIPLVAVTFWFGSKMLPESSCSDNRRNQSEFGVDCGGPCAPCELRNPKPVTLFWVRLVPVREGVYDVAAEVENTNEVLSSGKLQYEFTLFDGSIPVAIKRGSTFIFAQEKIHIIEPNVRTSQNPTNIEFKIIGAEWEYRGDPKPNVVVEKREYRVEDVSGRKESVVEITVSNRSLFDFKEAVVQVILLDQDENLIGVNRGTTERLNSGEKQSIKMTWPKELPGKVKTIIVEPRVNVFD